MKYKLTKEMVTDVALWYEKNKRELPWRDTGNPYHVWISEIMLQQTRIEAVKIKYQQFIRELPTIEALADCELDKLMRLWEGLGYYSRARNLQKCAKILVEEYGGKLPEEYDQLKKLPGIGPYTAGAIASICFSKPVPAVDGNVLRVLSRVFANREDVRNVDVRKLFEDIISEGLSESVTMSGSFNQGLMEIGEVVCVPNGKPDCKNCPLCDRCQALKQDLIDTIPYRSKLKDRKILQRTIIVIRDGETFLLHKRGSTGLLAGLYEFYGLDEKLSRFEVVEKMNDFGIEVLRIKKLPSSKHIFTHLEWHMTAYEVQVTQIENLLKDDYYLVNREQLQNMAIPSAFKTYMDWYALREK